jgi:DNA ligase D-like protein (predicted ligase)
MLATPSRDRFSDPGWLFEPKLDGVRAICSRDGGEPVLWSRNRASMNPSYPEIVAALARGGGQRFVADGEVVAFSGGRTSFEALQRRIHLVDPARARASGVKVYYYLFDLLHFDGNDAVSLPLRQRKKLLRRAFPFSNPLRLTTYRHTAGEAYAAEACARGWEGVVAKRSDSPYRPGRSLDWLKFKCTTEQEFVVGGFTEPTGSRVGMGALLLGYYDAAGRLRYAGKVGTGYDTATLAALRERLDGLRRSSSPFAERVDEPGSHGVRPVLVVQVGFTEWTRDGKLRHPRYLGLRADKDPADVVGEQCGGC